MKNTRLILLVLGIVTHLFSFSQPFTHADTLRGSYGSSRNWWDVLKYDIHAKFNINDSSISGFNHIYLKVIKKGTTLQLDLQHPLELDSILFIVGNSPKRRIKSKDIRKDGDAYFIPASLFSIPNTLYPLVTLTVHYHGKPHIAKKAPWDGGMVWKKDKNQQPFVSFAVQGYGASAWYPCKDHQGDEPDSAAMHITVPDSLVCVGNGRLRNTTKNNDGTTTFNWAVVNPINNYNIIPSIGKYVHFNEVYQGDKGPLDLDYWVLDYNLDKAKKQFTDVPRMLKAFEYWFGPYPFYEDGFKLVEAPHLGMEHQSAVAYGNGYRNGYMGRDLSGSGFGLKWDFIIIHESGHEWFANNISTKDIADMWVHEGFTNYSETLFTEYYYGKDAGTAYISGIRKNISNDKPIIGPYAVNKEGSGDMYYKASNMIHTIRQVIDNDSLFRKILRGLNATFYHQTVTSTMIEQYIEKQSGKKLNKIFDQYLRTAQVPILEYKVEGYNLSYRYDSCIAGFNLPLRINFKGSRWIKPTSKWETLVLYPEGDNKFSVDPNFYINAKKVD